MEKRKITAYRLCKDCDIPHASFLKIKSGASEFKISQLIRISKYFQKDLNYLILGQESQIVDEDLKKIKVPIIGSAACGPSLKEYVTSKSYLYMSGIGNLCEPFIIKAKGDSMNPLIFDGDYILCSKIDIIRDKMLVVISYKTEPETSDGNIKFLRIIDDGRYLLMSYNIEYKPYFIGKREIENIYKVNKIIRDIK